MPSQAMQDVIDTLRGQQKAAASQPSPTLEELRAAFAPAGRLHPLPDDVVVTDVNAGGVPAHWLATALLVAVRDAGQPLPAAAVLMSPTVDLTSSGASMTERAGQDPVSTPALLRQLAAGYLAGANPRTPLASPLFASLAGLPPLLIQTGTADLLLSDSERLAAAATRAGVHVTLHIGDGLPHVYPIMAGTPEAAQATEQTGDFLRTRVR
jgi:monoterpene epsilon-lactone hydrolase